MRKIFDRKRVAPPHKEKPTNGEIKPFYVEKLKKKDFPSSYQIELELGASSEKEYFLLGSESSVLVTYDEPLYSRRFVQCSAALIKNKRTGMVSLIHESMWSVAATSILAMQKDDNLGVITLEGPLGGMVFKDIKNSHKSEDVNSLKEIFVSLDKQDRVRYREIFSEELDRMHFYNGSTILGISKEEVLKLFDEALDSNHHGETNFLSKIKLPVTEEDGILWSLVYKPEVGGKKDVIKIYHPGTSQIFYYSGFSS